MIGEAIDSGFYFHSGIEVEIGYEGGHRVEVRQNVSQRIGGVVEALYIELLRVGVGAANGGVGERADTRQDEEDASQQVGSNAGFFAVLVPSIFEFGLGEIFIELVRIYGAGFRREAAFMQDDFGIGDAGQEAADGEFISAEDGSSMADDLVEVDAVGLKESAAEQGYRDGEADVLEVGGGSEMALADLVDVEGEFGADVGMLVLIIGDDGPIFFAEFGKFDGDSFVDRFGVADGIADVV